MSIITRAYGATKLLLKAKAPTIMVVGGVSAMGAGTVLASLKTLKVEEVLSKHAPVLEQIEEATKLDLPSYDANVARADRIKVYARAGVDLGKLYAVPGVFLVGGASLIFGGHHILLQRNATLALAFTGLKKTFDAYRGRVVENLGAEVDHAFYHGTKDGSSILTTTGKLKEGLELEAPEDADPYNRVFDQWSSNAWQNDLGCNKMFIHQQQRFAQEKLNRRGYLYLSEVYEALGFDESPLSRVVGWKVTKSPDGTKNFPVVDFGLDSPHFDDYKWSGANAIYLDFNCQGLIVGGQIQKILEQA